jgi:hypothetical protein
MENINIVKNERPHSYEYGKAGARVKIYFETVQELKQKLLEVRTMEQELEPKMVGGN